MIAEKNLNRNNDFMLGAMDNKHSMKSEIRGALGREGAVCSVGVKGDLRKPGTLQDRLVHLAVTSLAAGIADEVSCRRGMG